MSERAEVWLDRWCADHVNAVAYPRKRSEGEGLAAECRTDAKRAGISDKDLDEAAGGDLTGYMLDELSSKADAEVERLVQKDPF